MLLSISAAANSATVNLEPCLAPYVGTCITSIQRIPIQGSLYDMTVRVGAFRDLYPNPSTDLPFWGNGDLALETRAVISSVLSEHGLREQNVYWQENRSDPIVSFPYAYALHPVDPSIPTNDYIDRVCLAANPNLVFGCIFSLVDTSYAYATFTRSHNPAHVPVPAIGPALLFLLAVLMAAMVWKRPDVRDGPSTARTPNEQATR